MAVNAAVNEVASSCTHGQMWPPAPVGERANCEVILLYIIRSILHTHHNNLTQGTGEWYLGTYP